jgi:hypothetical protein
MVFIVRAGDRAGWKWEEAEGAPNASVFLSRGAVGYAAYAVQTFAADCASFFRLE